VVAADRRRRHRLTSSTGCHLRRAAHRAAIQAHYDRYPEDRPSRAEVAAVQLRRRGDELAGRTDLLEDAEQILRQVGADPSADEVVAAARVLAAVRTAA